MSLLTLGSYFTRYPKDKETQIKKEPICEEFIDLYDDDDFLEIMNMNTEELDKEIYATGKDPDEVLAMIQGNLDNKIIPLKKNVDPINTENLMHLLFNLMDEKIIRDVFNRKKNKFVFAKINPIFSVFIVSILALFIVPPINFQKNKHEVLDVNPISINSVIKEEKKPDDIKFVTKSPIGIHEKNSNPIMKSAWVNRKKILQKETPHNFNKNKFVLKSGETLYKISKEHGFSVASWSLFKDLPSFNEGNVLVVITDKNDLKGLSYIKNDGSVFNYSLEGGKLNKTKSKIYYVDDINVGGKIKTSLSSAILKTKELINNPEMAHILTAKIKNYLKNNSNVDLNSLGADTPYEGSVRVRKNKETNKVMYIEAVNDFLVKEFVIAHR